MTEFAELIAGAKRPSTTVPLCLRGDLTAPYRELEQKLSTASRTPPSLGQKSEAMLIAEQMQALEAEMTAATKTFRLEAMPAKKWSDFHATQPERAEDDTDETWSARWFAWICELVARSVVEPVVMTAEQVAELCDVLSGGQWDELSETAWRLNSRGVTVPFSVAASALIPSAGQS